MPRFRPLPELCVIGVGTILILLIFSHFVPFNMDEFYQYQPLAVRYYPLNMLNTFRESSSAYDLAPFDEIYLPLRSFSYSGSFPCLLYYPIFKLWTSPYSARLLGLIMLIAQAFLLSRIFRIRTLYSWLFLIFFMPYAFMHIVDLGPVSFQTTSVFLIYYLLQKWSRSAHLLKTKTLIYPAFIGIIIFFAIWTKLAFFYVLSAFIGLIIFNILKNWGLLLSTTAQLKKLVLHLFVFLLFSAMPTLLLLNSTDRQHKKYYEELFKTDLIQLSADRPYKISSFFTNPLLSGHKIFKVNREITLQGVIIILVFILFLSLGILQLHRKKEQYGDAVFNICLFLLTGALIAVHSKTWAMHHIVLSFPFLILAVFEIASRLYKSKLLLIIAGLFLVTNLSLYFEMARLTLHPFDHPSKLKINKLLNEKYADDHVFIIIDWGFYYIKALYGKKSQCVLYIEPFNNPKQASSVKAILNKTRRKALFLGRIDSKSNLTFMKKAFPSLLELPTGFDTGNWRIWYEPSK